MTAIDDCQGRMKTPVPKHEAQTIQKRLHAARDFALFLTVKDLMEDQRTKGLLRTFKAWSR